MSDILKPVLTRFRAYQLGSAGSSFSYFAADRFTLIEGRLSDVNKSTVLAEMRICGCSRIDTLHITSWDQDHCNEGELELIFRLLEPRKIEYPGYVPHTDNATACLESIKAYQARQQSKGAKIVLQAVTPNYIASLDNAKGLGYNDIFYHPRTFYESSNDNSTVKLFRHGSFNVVSLGDIEHPNLGAYLRRNRMLKTEVDVLILAHHGAENGVTTKPFLEALSPTVAICSSNFDNQFEHPKPEVRQRLDNLGIPLFTTKTGDVVIESIAPHRANYRVTNLISDSTKMSTVKTFRGKKSRILSMNADTVHNRYHPGARGPR